MKTVTDSSLFIVSLPLDVTTDAWCSPELMALTRNKGDAITRILFMIIQITAVNSMECTQFFTIFEERSCPASGSIQMKPATINSMNWNISRHGMDLDEHCYDLLNEDCFLELSCEDQETVCEEVLITSTDTTPTDTPYTYETTMADYSTEDSTYNTIMYYDTDVVTEITEMITEEREFFTLFTEKTCGDTNITEIEYAPINYETWNESRYDIKGDEDCFNGYPALDSFLELYCEEVTTICNDTGVTDKLISDELDPAVTYTLIAIGAVASAVLLSYISYCAADKVKDVLQSGVYRLPQ